MATCACCDAQRNENEEQTMPLERTLILSAMLALCAGASAEENPTRNAVPFSDPSRPGQLQVHLVTGSIVVRGSDTKQVIIETHAASVDPESHDPQASGLHRLRQEPSFTVEEQNNIMSISGSFAGSTDLEIQVPARTRLQLGTVNRGDVRVEGVDSDLEVSNVNGSILLTRVGGSVVAHTVNGKILVTLTRVEPQKPMAFTTLNGSVDVQLPQATRANLKLRSDNGSVLTDFELKLLPQSNAAVIKDTRQADGRYRLEVSKVIYGALNGGGPDIELRTFNGNIYLRKGS
jgi:DUF4097 and DUF4098 domain-containing protein YvlB